MLFKSKNCLNFHSANTARCKGAATGTSNAGNCEPNVVWGGIKRSSDSYYKAFKLENGTYGSTNCDGNGFCPYTRAFSVR